MKDHDRHYIQACVDVHLKKLDRADFQAAIDHFQYIDHLYRIEREARQHHGNQQAEQSYQGDSQGEGEPPSRP